MTEKIIEGIKYLLEEETLTAEVIKGYDGNIIIPETVVFNEVTYRVTSIGERAFANYDFITSIVIPDSVTSIGEEAFYDCEFLASIVIGNGVTSIGEEAFSRCESLTSIVIPDSVTSIGQSAFQDCSSLTSIAFNGTKAQWQQIAFAEDDWNEGVPASVIHCTDGNVKIEDFD